MAMIDQEQTSTSHARAEVVEEIWGSHGPSTNCNRKRSGYAFFTFRPVKKQFVEEPSLGLLELIRNSWLTADSVVYEDFLPRSAAGIFASNPSSEGSTGTSEDEPVRDSGWMSKQINRQVLNSATIYSTERVDVLIAAAQVLGLDPAESARPW